MTLKVSQNHKNITKMAPKIGPKSIKNRGCVADAFLERFGAALGSQRGATGRFERILLATIFGPKSKKWHPKRHPKIDAEKVSKNYAKWTKNEAKMGPKSTIFMTFSKKAKSHEMLCFTIENGGSGMPKT